MEESVSSSVKSAKVPSAGTVTCFHPQQSHPLNGYGNRFNGDTQDNGRESRQACNLCAFSPTPSSPHCTASPIPA